MTQACEGIRVLDFGHGMAGALTSMYLSDNGAEVIKVEPPDGDPDRANPAFLQWARGKSSIVLDLKTPEGLETAHGLARDADVVIEAFRPGTADRLGIGYQPLSELNRRLVYCSISGFGQKGAHSRIKGYDAVVAAKTGRMLHWKKPWRRDGPLYEAIARMSFGASHLACHGILSALLAREDTGRGQWVQTSLIQAATAHTMGNWMVPAGMEEEKTRDFSVVRPSDDPHEMPAGYIIAQCKDGRWMQMASTTVHLFKGFVTMLGLGDIYDDPRYAQTPYIFPSPEEKADFITKMKQKMAEKTSQEWVKMFLEDGNIGGEVYETSDEFMAHPQILHNGFGIELDDPRVGKMRQIGHFVAFTDTPSIVGGPAPDLGEHTQAIMARLDGQGSGWETPAKAPNQGVEGRRKPLEGITVLELASFFAAPFGITLLAELGARIIKIEPPTGDLFRRLGEGCQKTVQGKESIAIDLKTQEGREVFYDLVRKADALMHNFRPGSWERIGVDYETVQKVNPNLVYLYAGSYGSGGPWARQPAFHPVLSAITGSGVRMAGEGNPPLDSFQGDPDGALAVGTAMLMGLQAKLRTGKGQYLESRMITSGAYDVSDRFYDYEGKPPERLPDSGQHGIHALYRLYETSDGWVFLGCPNEGEWMTLCEALGRRDLLEDERFLTGERRIAHDEELIDILTAEFKSRTADECETGLLDRDVACVRADGPSWAGYFFSDPSNKENGLHAMTSHPHFGGDYWRQGPTVHFSDMEMTMGPPALIGEHTRPILQELGYSQEKIAELEETKAVLHDGPWAFAGRG